MLQNQVLPFSSSSHQPQKRLVYMRTSGSFHHSNKCILILLSGLTDPGIQGLPYVDTLAHNLVDTPRDDTQVILVQPWLSSSLYGYGASSLGQDVVELDALLDTLLQQEPNAKVILMGHSTGAQIVVSYLKKGKYVMGPLPSVLGGILQGPVSDRQYAEWQRPKDLDTWLPVAKDMIASGKSLEFMPRCVDEAPMTAYRYHSLYSKLGDDDVFSSDLSLEDYRAIYNSIPSSCHLMLLFSEKDEYVPPGVHVERDIMLNIAQTCPAFRFARIIKGANHAIEDPENQKELIELVSSFISQIYMAHGQK